MNDKNQQTLNIQSNETISPCEASETTALTIWIHGTQYMLDKIVPWFFYCPSGMTSAKDIAKKYHLHSLAQSLCSTDPYNFQFNNFYFFGWSGKLSFTARQEAGKDLYHHINKLRNYYYEQHGTMPYIRIITHSHGGNVALQLANHAPNDFVIDELLLLACPVQEKTAHLVHNPIFKQVLSLYSSHDLIQIADPQGLYEIIEAYKEHKGATSQFFSKRKFPEHTKLLQTEITIDGKKLGHIDFLLHPFIKLLPVILHHLK